MFLDRHALLLTAALAAASFGCPSAETGMTGDDDGDGPRDGGTRVDGPRDGGTGTTSSFLASEKGHVRFKRNKRIRNDIAKALALPPTAVCAELGEYDCADFIHRITLGGVEAYVQGLNEPLPYTSITTPFAVERMALHACRDRVDDDLAAPGSAVIFAALGVDGDGKLEDVEAESVAAAIERLYRRALQRNPTNEEIEHLRQLYRDIEADGQPGAARDWAILSCHVVLSSMEALFY